MFRMKREEEREVLFLVPSCYINAHELLIFTKIRPFYFQQRYWRVVDNAHIFFFVFCTVSTLWYYKSNVCEHLCPSLFVDMTLPVLDKWAGSEIAESRSLSVCSVSRNCQVIFE